MAYRVEIVPYRVIYRVVEAQKEVDILHVRHGAQQQFKTGDLK
jgi:mRNA-degrading endonuclease RelE of RelBE toxin-antitoxin system